MKFLAIDSYQRSKAIAGLAVLIACAALLAQPAVAQKSGTMSTPTIACGERTPASIEIVFTAGNPTGAPAGFSLQWMTLEDWQNNGDAWFLSSDPELCKGSFSGNAFGHFYNVPAGSATTLIVGDFLFDNPGASTNCDEPLVCGTEYIFRAFSHANSKLKRSAFTSDLVCKTRACAPDPVACTRTQGYWKTHGPVGCQTGNNTNQWPVAELTLGTVVYTEAQLCSILNKPAQGNGLVALAHQAIAAQLNVANGASDAAVAAALTATDALIGSLVVPPVGSGFLHPSLTGGLTTTVASYNEGTIGPGHCP